MPFRKVLLPLSKAVDIFLKELSESTFACRSGSLVKSSLFSPLTWYSKDAAALVFELGHVACKPVRISVTEFHSVPPIFI